MDHSLLGLRLELVQNLALPLRGDALLLGACKAQALGCSVGAVTGPGSGLCGSSMDPATAERNHHVLGETALLQSVSASQAVHQAVPLLLP